MLLKLEIQWSFPPVSFNSAENTTKYYPCRVGWWIILSFAWMLAIGCDLVHLWFTFWPVIPGQWCWASYKMSIWIVKRRISTGSPIPILNWLHVFFFLQIIHPTVMIAKENPSMFIQFHSRNSHTSWSEWCLRQDLGKDLTRFFGQDLTGVHAWLEDDDMKSGSRNQFIINGANFKHVY